MLGGLCPRHARAMRLRPRPATDDLVVVPTPRYELRTVGLRTDLHCAVCSRVMGYDVRPERVEHDAPFFLEQHRPRCGG